MIATSYGVPPLTIPKREPGPIGSVLRSSAVLTRLFHRGSLRRSASVSKTCSGGHAIRVVVVTRTARRYHGAPLTPELHNYEVSALAFGRCDSVQAQMNIGQGLLVGNGEPP